ncbi:hypothetical protein ABTE34_21630, partial [Acinetobacter baumannii]
RKAKQKMSEAKYGDAVNALNDGMRAYRSAPRSDQDENVQILAEMQEMKGVSLGFMKKPMECLTVLDNGIKSATRANAPL